MKRLIPWLIVLVCLVAAPALLAQTNITCETLAESGGGPAHFIGLGNAYRAQGNYSRAIVAFTCALEQDPTYAPAYVSRAVAHVAQFNYPDALADYNRAIELAPSDPIAYNNRGILYALQANFGLAIADFTVVIALTPEDPTAYVNRALVHAGEGNTDLARVDLDAAFAIAPDYPPAHAALGALYLALAAESYATYAELTSNAPVPNGDAASMLASLQAGLETGDSAAWLSFMITR